MTSQREHVELPPLPALPTTPVVATSWPTDPPANAPFTGNGLLLLLNDAAQRATDTLAQEAPSGLGIDPIVDLARRAAAPLPSNLRKALAASSGLTIGSLDQQATAYRLGGAEAVHMINEPSWSPSPSDVERAVRLLTEKFDHDPTVRGNAFTIETERYTLSQSGRWWKAERRSGRWRLASAPADRLIDLLEP
ncbi:MAG: hypothetical protein R2706_02260 [Acidimicrobiales bacterium]